MSPVAGGRIARVAGALTATLALVVASCTGSGSTGAPATRISSPTESSRAGPTPAQTSGPAVAPFGPLAGLTWPAGSVPVGVLLHDDGTKLWAVPLSGKPRLLWSHPEAHVYEISSGPDGRELAYSVELPFGDAAAPSYVLYLLAADGVVRTVDVVNNFQSIESPIFLQPPTDLTGPIRLYWLRTSQDVSKTTGRLETHVMVLGDEGPLEVAVPLRYEEAAYEIHAYSGSFMFDLSLFRTNNVPTRLEILQDVDWGRDTDVSLTRWGDIEKPVNTDIFTGVAWVTPLEFVIPVAQDFYPQKYSLRLFRFGCEQHGSHVVYQGRGIDWGYSEAPWPILPGGPHTVLVLGASAVRRVRHGKAHTAPWLAVDLNTGRITATQATWIPPGRLRGWWTFVQPKSNQPPPTRSPNCSDLTWTYP